MRNSRLIFIIILILSFRTAFGHEDFWVIRDYGNIKVRVKSGFDYEEINNAFIIGQLAQALVKDLGYSKQVFLDFDHYYTGDCEPDYFISFDDGEIKEPWNDKTKKNLLKGKALVVRQVARTFDVITSLKLLEYSVANLEMVKSTQRQIEYNKNYCNWTINSIDTVLINKQVSQDNMSPLITNVFKLKIERPDKDFRNGISYYWQEGKYYVYHRKVGHADKVVLVLTCIYDFQKIESNINLIFDSDRAFYCITIDNDVVVSKHHEIVDAFENWRPYRVTKISENKLSINLDDFETDERTLLYTISSDELEQELKK